MTAIIVAYHSGYGHTKKQAEAVYAGVHGAAGAQAELLAIDGRGQCARRRLGSASGGGRHHFRRPHLHGFRVLAVQEVCRYVQQAVVQPALEGQTGGGFHQFRVHERR